MNTATHTKILKVILLGNSSVGKSSLMRRFVKNEFTVQCSQTIGVDFLTKSICMADLRNPPTTNKAIDDKLADQDVAQQTGSSNTTTTIVNNAATHSYVLQIWDTAGQERYASVRGRFYRGVDICMFTFALNDAESFRNLRFWVEDFVSEAPWNYTGGGVREEIPFIILGNKCDLAAAGGGDCAVAERDVAAWCDALREEYPNIVYFPTSAKDAINVSEAFHEAIRVWSRINTEFVRSLALDDQQPGCSARIRLDENAGNKKKKRQDGASSSSTTDSTLVFKRKRPPTAVVACCTKK